MKKYIKADKSRVWLKVILTVLMFLLYIIFFKDKLYFNDITGKTSIIRIIMPFIFMTIFSISLFIKIDIGEKNPRDLVINIIAMLFFIVFNFVIVQYGQGYFINIFEMWWFYIFLNFVTLGIFFMIIFSMSNSFKVSIITMNIVTLLFIFAEYYVLKLRGIGFAAGDIFSLNAAMNVAGSYSYELNFEVFMSLIIMITISSFVRFLPKNIYFKKFKRLFPILLTIILIITFIGGLNIDKVDKKMRVKYYRTHKTYKKKGLPVSFVKSIKDLIILSPKGYSVDNVEKILKDYKSDDKESKNDSPNIIIVMNEAFTDFTDITDLKINEDPLPFFHSLKENTIRGDLYPSVFGGGTSNTEFEVLTSNTMAYLPRNVNPYRIYIKDKFPNLTYILEDQGYGGLLALHPYKPNGYSRSTVYPLLGFKDFISIEDFQNPKLLGQYISDEEDYNKIIEKYEKHKKSSDSPFFLFNVTMQNHTPFTYPGLSNDIKLKYDTYYPEANQYMNRLKYSDKALKKLINYYKKEKKKTIIVFYGDHEPRLEHEFYDEVMKTYTKGKKYKDLQKYNSSFFIWANYDIDEKDDVKISTNYLGELILDIADLKRTGFNKYVSNLREKIPVLTGIGYIGDNGKFYSLDNKKSPYYKLIKDYEYIEYNNLFDTKNRVSSYFYLK